MSVLTVSVPSPDSHKTFEMASILIPILSSSQFSHKMNLVTRVANSNPWMKATSYWSSSMWRDTRITCLMNHNLLREESLWRVTRQYLLSLLQCHHEHLHVTNETKVKCQGWVRGLPWRDPGSVLCSVTDSLCDSGQVTLGRFTLRAVCRVQRPCPASTE